MNLIKDTSLVPNAGEHGVGFVYRDPDSGKVFVHATVTQVIVIARNHRSANGYPMGANFNQDVIDNICANMPGVCWNEPDPSLGQKLSGLAKALWQSARSGFATVTMEELLDRQKVCETSGLSGGPCEYYRGMNGMFGVMCGKCGCSKLKIHLKTSQCPKSLWPEL